MATSSSDSMKESAPSTVTEKESVIQEEKQTEENILREGIFTVHYPACKPLACEVFLTPTELILEEYDESGYQSDCDTLQERYPIEDIFGVHIVRNLIEEPSVPVVYFCVILYSTSSETETCRKRIPRIFEINESQTSADENLDVAKEWTEDIEHLLKIKYPNLHSISNSNSSKNGSIKKSLEDVFKDLKFEGDSCDSMTENNILENKKSDVDLEFCSGSFSVVRSVLFQRKLMVIVNPISGQGKGTHVYQEHISPVLADCGITTELMTTDHPGHARSFISSVDLKGIDGVICVGGDGLVNEVVNGLKSREDASKISNIPVGVIATGSGNGLARSIAAYYGESLEYRANPVLSSTLAVARGCVAPVNLAEIHLDQRVFYSFLSTGWGLLSDIDVESEVLRAIGEIRFIIWSFIRLAKLRRYNAELSYIPYDSSGSISSRVIIKDEFVSVYSACQSHIGSDMMFAPDAKPFDGTIHLTFLPSSTGRLSAAKFLAEIIRGQGQHINVNPVKYVKVKEFTIRNEGGIQGILTVDGEQVSGEEITVKMNSTPLFVFANQ